MNKSEFITHIANQYQCTKVEAEKAIDMFTSSVIDAMGQGKEISLVGFGNFTVRGSKRKPQIFPKLPSII